MSDPDNEVSNGMITIPERRIEAIDLVDEALATIRVIHTALNARDMLDDVAIHSLMVAVEEVFRKLIPLREKINQQHGAA
jgi:hypothetical protein